MVSRGVLLLVVLGLAPAGCGGHSGPEPQDIQPSTRARLQWKRNAMLEGDLARALELAPEALCSELGRGSCTRDVHHIALGGADPLVVGLYKPLHDTLATTPIVVDRVVLSACVARVTADRTADRTADPVVFAALDLEASAPAAESAAYRQTVTSLYRRFLSRDPDPGEFEVLADLLVDDGGSPVSSRDFAVLACYAVGTTTEFLFF